MVSRLVWDEDIIAGSRPVTYTYFIVFSGRLTQDVEFWSLKWKFDSFPENGDITLSGRRSACGADVCWLETNMSHHIYIRAYSLTELKRFATDEKIGGLNPFKLSTRYQMKVGDKVIVIERTAHETFEWEGEVVSVTDAYIETTHRRNSVTHPQWHNHTRAYEKTWIKHYTAQNIRVL